MHTNHCPFPLPVSYGQLVVDPATFLEVDYGDSADFYNCLVNSIFASETN